MREGATTEKVTFSLPIDLMCEVRKVVAAGWFPSQHEFVREALTLALQRSREEQLRCEFQEAAQDPLFRQDLEETEQAFQSADSETARMIPHG